MPVTDAKSDYAACLESARTIVLHWLREAHRNPRFLEGADAPEQLGPATPAIVERFIRWVVPAGFDLTTHETPERQFTVRWTHRGYDFVGFRQPPAGETPEEAKLLACAALLQNDWCRERLP